MNITMTSDVAEKLRALLDEEGPEARVRVRETKIGCACKSKIVLRLSIDERQDEDIAGTASTLPFVIHQDVVDQYGTDFTVSLDEHQSFDVQPTS